MGGTRTGLSIRSFYYCTGLLMVLVLGVGMQPGCVSYHSITRHGDDVYLAGSTSFFVFGSNWVKKCVEKQAAGENPHLYCQELEVSDPIDLTDEMVLKAVWHADWGWKCFKKDTLEKYSGEIVMQVTIDKHGKVIKAGVENKDLAATTTGACIVDSLTRLSFPLLESAKNTYVSLTPEDILDVHATAYVK